MANELIINASLPETRIALMENGEIQELLIERASGKGIVGNIYKGRVTRVLPGMQAAFVDIGLEKAAFLYVDDVYVHPEFLDDEEEHGESGSRSVSQVLSEVSSETESPIPTQQKIIPVKSTESVIAGELPQESSSDFSESQVPGDLSEDINLSDESHLLDDENDDDDSGNPVDMARDPDEKDETEGTLAPPLETSSKSEGSSEGESEKDSVEATSSEAGEKDAAEGEEGPGRRRHRRGRRGGRFRKRPPGAQDAPVIEAKQEVYPESYHEQVADSGSADSDRAELVEEQSEKGEVQEDTKEGRPETEPHSASILNSERRVQAGQGDRAEFKSHRGRDRRIRQKATIRPVRAQVNIQDLLKEGQEVLVQVAKDPIATKGARLTCHISLPGRHLVCMPTIDHVGVSRRIERDDERRRLREFVERNRPRNLGFIVRTASGKQQSEKRIKQDIEYLTHLWTEIREKAATVTAPALVYEDLNSVLRAVRDWVTEEIDKVIVDSRYHYNEILRFVSHFMPSLKQKVDLYHGDIPIFDAYGISTELSRSLERKVWLKSGGYIVVDQAEALVAIDVNTGRYVGKKNLEDTILKTNLEAVQEIAYQLRLRNCGGIIILDLIDMEKDENKHRVYRALEDALSRDRARPTILKISELGLVEMTRKRTRDTIIRTLCESCTHCEGKGFIKSKQTVAYEVMREMEREGIERDIGKILVQAHPDVIDILAIDERDTLDQMERRYRKQIYLQAIADFHPEQFEVTADKRDRADRGREHQGRASNERSGGHDQDRHRNRDRHRSSQISGPVTIIPVSEITPVISPVQSGDVGEVVVAEPSGNTIGKVIIQPIIQPISSEGTHSPIVPQAVKAPTSDDFYDEEDRLAFVRAQAAQDAALARLGSAHAPRNSGEVPKGDHRGPGGPRRGGRGRRGAGGGQGGQSVGGSGRFRRPNERRGPKPFGYSSPLKRNDQVKEGVSVVPDSSGAGNSSGEGNGGGGVIGGGGGDLGGGGGRSQAPV